MKSAERGVPTAFQIVILVTAHCHVGNNKNNHSTSNPKLAMAKRGEAVPIDSLRSLLCDRRRHVM